MRGKKLISYALSPIGHHIRNHSSNVAKPVVAAKAPYCVTVKSGQRISWCLCGLSKKQPFCDGSHKRTGLKPIRMTMEETCEVYFCGCKQTKTPPFCDGTHLTNAVQTCTVGDVIESA